ncbi:type VII toxin-antitoxin system MntA family adenylyltransferase antitoxin [Caldisericum exile]|uniref:Polymerase beta nucleotidyltransferase domain-containing protein n=1 Tax=Caldisericum exile (strain DSM 21853 / NBRC 104410 / AZM16c01) TaxID=511051 RepID=A0A7U6JH83_CALEA|nr:nucleotidyltransferase domain-containing protein [Caldisericum exile]BAL81652.1 hypothetical protein CSE_15260 [Caldisericum exile AZM16c01]
MEEIKKITKILLKKRFITFAILFGSFATHKAKETSDIDLGIFLKKNLTILDLGELVSELETITKRQIDIVTLNKLYEENPSFAYSIITTGKVLFTKDKNALSEYKTKVFLYYFDFKPTLRLINEAFIKRISEGRIGDRNYTG